MNDSLLDILFDGKLLFKRHGWIIIFFSLALLTRMNSYNIYIIDIFSLLALFQYKKYLVNDGFVKLLLSFSIVYVIMLYINDAVQTQFETIGYILCPIAYYAVGKSIVSRSASESTIITAILFFVIFSSIGLYITIFNDIKEFGIINIYRSIGDRESGSIAATLLGLIASIGIAGISYFFVCDRPLKSAKAWIFIICTTFSVLSVIHLINRTGLIVMSITIIMVVLYKVSGNIKQVLPIIGMLVLLYIVAKTTGLISDEVFEAYKGRNLEENTNSANGRFDRWIDALQYMIQYPTGWSKMPFAKFVHSIWLDVARLTGIVPFIIFIVVFFKAYSNTIKLYKFKNNILIGTLLGFSVCFLFSAAMEPVLEGASTYFYSMCFFWGIQEQYLTKLKNGKIVINTQ